MISQLDFHSSVTCYAFFLFFLLYFSRSKWTYFDVVASFVFNCQIFPVAILKAKTFSRQKEWIKLWIIRSGFICKVVHKSFYCWWKCGNYCKSVKLTALKASQGPVDNYQSQTVMKMRILLLYSVFIPVPQLVWCTQYE